MGAGSSDEPEYIASWLTRLAALHPDEEVDLLDSLAQPQQLLQDDATKEPCRACTWICSILDTSSVMNRLLNCRQPSHLCTAGLGTHL